MMKRALSVGVLAVVATLAAACGSEGEQLGPEGDSAATQAGGGGDSKEDAPPLGIDGSGGASADTGCKKVDFLFVIDNSISMKEEQEALIKSFPGFMSTIENTLDAKNDYQIMVVDTDAWGRCNKNLCADTSAGLGYLCEAASSYACKASKFDSCDNTLGAGVVQPAGEGASNEVCSFDSGKRYITQGQSDLSGTFACAASVGLAGHPSERPMDAMLAALDPGQNAATGCNDGFLRDDAILVVTFISDDPNYEDSGTPKEWYDAVVKAKGGNPDSVAVLGLTPAFDGCSNANKAERGKHWSEFVGLWGNRGLEASVCNQDYTSFFQQAVGIIDNTCDEFVDPTPR